MLAQGLSFLKTLIKISLDSYVVPGTLTGTQIFLLYVSQWKRDVVFFTALTRQLIRPEADNAEHPQTSRDRDKEPASGD